MSADNWRRCPKCLKAAKERQDARELSLEEQYGRVPREKYLAQVAAVGKSVVDDVKDEFREDYEIGMTEDGEFYVRYSGHCTRCGWEHQFKHDERKLIT